MSLSITTNCKTKPLSLIMSIKTSKGRYEDPVNEDATQKYSVLRLNVFKRDRFTCQGCGLHVLHVKGANEMSLKASGYLEAHHKDNNHQHNVSSNLISVCPFCHQVFHIGFAGFQKRIQLIYLPSISQADLNLMCVCIGIAMQRGGGIGDDAAALYNIFENQKWEVQRQYGEFFADPTKLSAALSRLAKVSPALYAKRNQALQKIRVLPVLDKFITQIQYWNQTIFLHGKQWEKQWEKLFQQWEVNLHPSLKKGIQGTLN